MVVRHGFYFIKLNARSLLLITFFVSLSSMTVWLDRIERSCNGVKPGVMMGEYQLERLLPTEVRQVVLQMALQYYKSPREPRIDRESGLIMPEQPGQAVDVVTCTTRIVEAAPGERLDIVLIPIPPHHHGSEIARSQQVQGDYETWVNGSFQRHSNIRLASRGINNILLWPGEEFSFNDVVGPRSLERGYLPAPIILLGERSLDYGGGICQVSSTLYNAVEEAGLNIRERHQHSLEVGYVPKGRDATVTYGYLDFRFQNNRDHPIIIRAGMDGDRLWVKIMGRST